MNLVTIKSSHKRLIWCAYLISLIYGMAYILPFVIIPTVSINLHISLELSGYILTSFILGVIITQFLNGYLVKFISIKSEILVIFLFFIIFLISGYFCHNYIFVTLILFLFGLSCGILITLPTYILVNSLKNTDLTREMNINDFCFSLGTFISPYVASKMMNFNNNYILCYLVILIAWIFLIILLRGVSFPILKEIKIEKQTKYSRWNLSVVFVGVAIFLYLISYSGLTYVIPQFLQNQRGFNMIDSVNSITIFWLFYCIGCLISSILSKKIPINFYIVISAIIAIIFFSGLLYSKPLSTIYIDLAMAGFGCSCIYSSSMSFGSKLVKTPSPRIMSFFLFLSGLGGFVGEMYSNYMFYRYSFQTVEILTIISLVLSMVIFLAIGIKRKILFKKQ